MDIYASVEDYEKVYNIALNNEQQKRLLMLIELASSLLREEANKRNMNLSAVISSSDDKANVAKMVVLACVHRVMSKDDGQDMPLEQFSQSALGYTFSGTYVNPGDDLYYLRNELKRMGIMKQRYGAMDIYET
ncbi:phage protein Gp19/Gp15/Gp42 [Catenibacterium mitsuokai DSM 15897]|uniref:Gp19/Gp15/Gp42 family protein n=1 Tax=Catenibacterium mitsuokai TaxID=100886 RepID=UPI000196CAED|nr:Gp19/Gp15/Gp42 family protein [Catenibacterium mitsuokai]EEF93199.1 phage protein Gp19/Gp15/Gp42 [Catenibacterium mitsuokai DSM 15897]UWO51992.1 phage Gp19/Gp15/Gp42 family protein [Catenibacterium mitsuokai]